MLAMYMASDKPINQLASQLVKPASDIVSSYYSICTHVHDTYRVINNFSVEAVLVRQVQNPSLSSWVSFHCF